MHLARLIEMTSLIVWDEASMNNKCCIEALDRSLKDVLTSSINAHLVKPSGGKSVFLGGDFRRLLPVIPGGTMEEIINASLSRSSLWSHFKIFTINENMRLSSNDLSIEDRDNLMKFSQRILLI